VSEPVATPEMYRRVFEAHAEGRVVYDDLVMRFCRNSYVKGGLEADRQTCFNAGQASVPGHITMMINRAAGLDEPTDQET
jgi:hypothetical protein